MLRPLFPAVLLAALCMLSAIAHGAGPAAGGDPAFRLASDELVPGGRVQPRHVYNGFGCSGGNLSPALSWSGAPGGTRSFAITVFDPDAPTGHGWWHWLIYDIPAASTTLAAGAGDPASGKAPPGSMQAVTDFGTAGFGGPCPPPGDKPHRYVFTLYALSVGKLAAGRGATAAAVDAMLNAGMIEKTGFTVYYGR
ncbi:MAG TPA: YbhB/YbcL family Raf kinase inhibitor-like protein [Steroidobacteraceae bacterium]|nr:YbhB/YbcL family Raf kinase inhibitor-like protein [Steroidobacteraceae bacterium]